MKKLYFIPFLIILVAAGWVHNPKKTEYRNGRAEYKYEATFTDSVQIASGQVAFVGKNYDVSWTSYPFTVFYDIDTTGAPVATTVAAIYYGVINGQRFPVDSTIVVTTDDSMAYTTTDLGNLKFPMYQVDLRADSCSVTLVIF